MSDMSIYTVMHKLMFDVKYSNLIVDNYGKLVSERDEYLEYLRKKYKLYFKFYRELSKLVETCRLNDISIEQASKDIDIDIEYLEEARDLLDEYNKTTGENIDYIINNPPPTLTSQNVNSNAESYNSSKETDSIDGYDIMNDVIWTLMDDPNLQQCIELLQTKGIPKNKISMVSAQVMKNIVDADPELYGRFIKALLDSCSNVIQPIITNGQQFELNTLYTNLINNLETHAGTAQAPSSITKDTVRSDDDQVLSKDDGINLVQQIIMDVIRSDPSLYKNFREALLGLCSKVIQPIVTNGNSPG